MTEQNLTTYNRTTELLASSSENEIKEVARKLMKLTPAGSRLTAEQAVDLAVYSFMTGLNPFNNECYFMDRVGPVPGIAGYRVKTMEWLRATSGTKIVPRVYEEYRKATREEANFNPDAGDVAWVCTLYDSVSKEHWEKRIVETATIYSKMGASFEEARRAAKEDVGDCPSWSAVGVVKADEHFSGNAYRNNMKIENEYKPEMWDRNERAKKRAAKGCYRKGFPTVNIPDAEEGDYIDLQFAEMKDNLVKNLDAGTIEDRSRIGASKAADILFGGSPVYTPDELNADTDEDGYITSEIIPEKRPVSEDINDLSKEPVPVLEQPQPAPVSMSLETAMAVKNSDGVSYGDLDSAKLSHIINGILTGMKKTDLTPEQREDYALKRDAIKTILQSRSEH